MTKWLVLLAPAFRFPVADGKMLTLVYCKRPLSSSLGRLSYTLGIPYVDLGYVLM